MINKEFKVQLPYLDYLLGEWRQSWPQYCSLYCIEYENYYRWSCNGIRYNIYSEIEMKLYDF